MYLCSMGSGANWLYCHITLFWYCTNILLN
ncbi:DUF3732 domain-containing protein [Moraxella sp. ZJ142]